MRVTSIYTAAGGDSAFGEVDIPIRDAGEIGLLSERLPATGIIFRETPGDYDYPWHNTPRRQYVVMLDGEVDFTVSSGETRRFGSGDIVLLEDVDGKGHYSRAVNGRVRRSIFVTLE